MKEYKNNSIDRAFMILDFLVEHKAATLTVISKKLGIPKATAFRILQNLEEKNAVMKADDHSEKFSLGHSMVYYGAASSEGLDLVKVAKPVVDDLSKITKEVVNLCVEFKGYALTIYKNGGEDSSIIATLVPFSPLNCSASGKVLLQNRTEKEVKDYFELGKVENRTINSIDNYTLYKRHEEQYKKEGVFTDDEEYDYGLFCIAAPIIKNDTIIASISVSGPKQRMEHKGVEKMKVELLISAQKLSEIVFKLKSII